MKRVLLLLLTAVIAFTACQNSDDYTPAEQGFVLSAKIEQGVLTKTEIGSDKDIVWSENDQIVAFMKSSVGSQCQILPEFVGKNYADFSILGDSEVGSDWEHIVAYYPYSTSVQCAKSENGYTLDVVLPSEHTYIPNSFSKGTFPMVAVSSNNSIAFKNICGGIKLKFKGTAKIVSITITGKNNEKLSGEATVTAKSNGDAPAIAMAQSALTSATLKCESSVELNETTATEFIISLPPVEFTKGFTIVATDTDNRTYTVETSKKNSVLRSSLLVMPELTLVRDAKVEDFLGDWTNVTANYGPLPEYIDIYKSPSVLMNRDAVAYIAVADLKAGATWDIWSVCIDKSADNGANGWLTTKTNDYFVSPSDIYASDYNQQPPIVINGGFYYYSGSDRHTASLAVRNSLAPLSYNINYEAENGDYENPYFPTRAAFLEYADGTFDACWTYVLWNYDHFIYPTPAPANNTNQPVSTSFPAGGKVFEAKTGIGGGPVLIDNGIIVNTWYEEMLSGINPEGTEPRTAIGITANKEIVFFVSEGRGQTDNVYGFTTEEVATILHNVGCVEAINLDGGSSSYMLVNGIATIKPGDGSVWEVASAVMIR
ncbi:MAG: phosphodiester glycosidase family protein [Bacteroidales bacterium]|nr:phosphodiester glycosidase family protein [Bacteroidales bacterium]